MLAVIGKVQSFVFMGIAYTVYKWRKDGKMYKHMWVNTCAKGKVKQ